VALLAVMVAGEDGPVAVGAADGRALQGTNVEDAAACAESMREADEDADGALNADEFSRYVQIESNGLIDEDFQDMSVFFVMVFYRAACTTCYLDTGDTECCLGDAASIPILEPGSEHFEYTYDFVCQTVTTEIASLPTVSPTEAPVPAPATSPPVSGPTTSEPTVAPTVVPVPLECVSFQYTVEAMGLTADEIFNEVDNSIKQGLLMATRSVTISILNETYPRTEEDGRELALQTGEELAFESAIVYRFRDKGIGGLLTKSQLETLGLSPTSQSGRPYHFRLLGDARKSRAVRNLVYYHDDYPVEITDMWDTRFCGGSEQIGECVVVDTTVCVVLEEGDDPAEVRQVLLRGFREAINNGDFGDAMPSLL
jgi:hypothetical protein